MGLSNGLNLALAASAECYQLSAGHPTSAALERGPVLVPVEHLEMGGLETYSVKGGKQCCPAGPPRSVSPGEARLEEEDHVALVRRWWSWQSCVLGKTQWFSSS